MEGKRDMRRRKYKSKNEKNCKPEGKKEEKRRKKRTLRQDEEKEGRGNGKAREMERGEIGWK